MTIETKIIALAQAIGADVKILTGKVGDLSSLPTTAKTNLVSAIAELYSLTNALIDDEGVSTDVAWSAAKIADAIEVARQATMSDLIGGASEALDTFKELQDALGNDPTFATTVATALNNRVRFDEEQTLTAGEKLIACTNIGVGNPEHDFAADYAAAKV